MGACSENAITVHDHVIIQDFDSFNDFRTVERWTIGSSHVSVRYSLMLKVLLAAPYNAVCYCKSSKDPRALSKFSLIIPSCNRYENSPRIVLYCWNGLLGQVMFVCDYCADGSFMLI